MEKHVYREYHSGHMVELAADTLAAAIEEAAEEARRAHSDDVRSETLWVHGVVQALTEDGELIEEHPVRVAIDPEEPECKQIGLLPIEFADEGEHDWQSPHEIVGGLEDSPGVWGKGGGVVYTEVCVRCGTARITDTWAQDPETGEQGLHSVKYEPYLYEEELDEYIRHHGHCYAVVDRDGYVQDVVYDLREASDPQVTEHMNRLAGYGGDGHRWVLVDGGPCDPGDRLDVDDEEGTATLAE